jgi:putative molybdopterin biosynthesis protein
VRGAAPVFAKALKPLLKPGLHKLIGCSRRMQGLMMRREHAGTVRNLSDVVRLRLRFVNRQPGSGTRMLVDHLLHESSIDPGSDAGVGVEAAALQFGLHFAPLVEENYFLACLKPNLEHPAVRRLCTVLAGDGWSGILANLPGYRPALGPGKVLMMTAALPWWRFAKAKVKRGDTAPAARALAVSG